MRNEKIGPTSFGHRRSGKTMAMSAAAENALRDGKSVVVATPIGNLTYIGVDYGSKPSVGVVAGKCASCDVMFQGETHSELNYVLHEHAKICPKRPLEVGDYVRWERTTNRDLWAEGELMSMGDDEKHCYLDVASTSTAWPGTPMRGEQRFDGPNWKTVNLRRIPRPVADVKAIHERSDGNLYYGDMKVTDGPFVSRPETPSQVTVTYDGLTAEQCLEDYTAGQRDDPLPRDLKPAQLAAARELWSLQLRQRVAETEAADRERDRLQVVIDDGEVEPWR